MDGLASLSPKVDRSTEGMGATHKDMDGLASLSSEVDRGTEGMGATGRLDVALSAEVDRGTEGMGATGDAQGQEGSQEAAQRSLIVNERSPDKRLIEPSMPEVEAAQTEITQEPS